MSFTIKLAARAAGGCGTGLGFVKQGHPLEITLEQFNEHIDGIENDVILGELEVSYYDPNTATWVGVAANDLRSFSHNPENAQVAHYLYYLNMQADATVVHLYDAGGHLVGATAAGAFSGAQPIHPRAVKAVWTGANSFGAGETVLLTVTGVDALGRTRTDVLTFTAAATVQGFVPFIYIASLTIGTNPIIAGDTLSVQLNSKIGVPFQLSATSLRAVMINAAYEPASDFTVDTTYGTILETGQTISANDDYEIYAVPANAMNAQ